MSSNRIPGCLEALLRPQMSLTLMLQDVQTALEGKRESVSPEKVREAQLLPSRCPSHQHTCQSAGLAACWVPDHFSSHWTPKSCFSLYLVLHTKYSCLSRFFLRLSECSLIPSPCVCLTLLPQKPSEPEGPQWRGSVLSSDVNVSLVPAPDFKNKHFLVKIGTSEL